MTTTITTRSQMFYDIFTTALEGGIGYWSKCSLYHNSLPSGGNPHAEGHREYMDEDIFGFKAIVHDFADDESADEADWPVHTIDRDVIARGYRLAASAEWRNKLAWSSAKPPLIITSDTDWDYDAGDADMIVQLGLFNDVVYG
jgi:hypothetical protein